ncbi:MAG TPA: Zn-dependent alcohol dehydrogenase [Actinomycetota bacterium]|jgi:S-(hydroxymethyl)glutathione dehydrogenase/alcohol dehydrogenase|nr:Zn-dependent alcohol dehydrogenase [Actinomycetota bacterium]
MKAAIVRELNAPVEIVDAQIGAPGANQVKVKVAAAGVCHSDLSVQNGTIPWMFPALLGHEGAGVVTEVGEGVDSPSVGDHVIFNWVPFCGECNYCKRGETWLCNAGYPLGLVPVAIDGGMAYPMAATGTFAEEAIVHKSSAIAVPKDIPLDVAALVGCGVTTGVGAAVNTANVAKDSTVLVIGCGGVGMNVIQGAKINGARAIVAMDRFENKAEEAKRFGATHAATPETIDAIKGEVTGAEGGFDYAFEVIGNSNTIRAAFDHTRKGGTTCIVGLGRAEDMVQLSSLEFFLKDANIKGCVYGSSAVEKDYKRFLDYWKKGELDLEGLISKHISIEDVPAAFEAMERGEVIRSVISF